VSLFDAKQWTHKVGAAKIARTPRSERSMHLKCLVFDYSRDMCGKQHYNSCNKNHWRYIDVEYPPCF